MTPHSVPVSAEELLRHRAWVRALARTLVRDDASVDDLEQDVWVAALERPPQHSEAATTWLTRVVRSRAVDMFRSHARRGAREEAAARPEAVPSAAETVARADAHRRVVEAVMELEEPYRTAVLLRFFEDVPPREVARRTGVPVETARTHVRRGVERLRERLAGRTGPCDSVREVGIPYGSGRDGGSRDDGAGYAALVLLAELPAGAGKAVAGVAGTAAGNAVAGKATAGGTIVALAGKNVAAAVAVTLAVGAVAFLAARPAVAPAPRAGAAVAPPVPGESPPRESSARAAPPDAPGDAAAAADAAGPRKRLRFRREGGAGVAGTSVVICTASDVAVHAKLPADGALDVPSAGVERSAIVTVPGGATLRIAVPAGADPADLVIPEGAVVAGHVLVDGRAPESPLELTLWFAEPTVARGLAPEILYDIAEDGGPDFWAAHATTGDGGTFRFTGAPAGTDVRFGAAAAFVVEDPAVVRVPRDGVTVRLRRLPRVVGRAVRAGQPLAKAGAGVDWTRGATSGRDCAVAGDDGRFVIVLQESAPDAARLSVTDGDGLGATAVELRGPFRGDHDVGTVEVPDPWSARMSIVVVDPEGKPVAGAVAAVPAGTGGDNPWLTSAAGADGRVDLPAGATAGRAVVAAVGFRFRDVTLRATGGSPERVELERSCVLRVTVTGPGDASATELGDGAVVRVSGDGRTFDEPMDEIVYSIREAAGATHASSSVRGGEGDGGEASTFRIGGGPPMVVPHTIPLLSSITVPWLLPERIVHVELFDAGGERLAAQDVRLATGEQRTLGLRWTAHGRTFRGVVRGADGSPLAGARVIARAAALVAAPPPDGVLPTGGRVATTDAAGRFEFAGVHSSALALFVDAPGRTPWFRRSVAVPADGAELEIATAPGATLVVRLRGEAAARAGAQVWADSSDSEYWMPGYRTWSGVLREDGAIEIAKLPASEVRVTVRTPAGETCVTTRGDAGSVEIDLPAVKEE